MGAKCSGEKPGLTRKNPSKSTLSFPTLTNLGWATTARAVASLAADAKTIEAAAPTTLRCGRVREIPNGTATKHDSRQTTDHKTFRVASAADPCETGDSVLKDDIRRHACGGAAA
jgi:hypothetical protein